MTLAFIGKSRAILNGADSHALAIEFGSSGSWTGRMPGLNKRVKKLSQEVKPKCFSRSSDLHLKIVVKYNWFTALQYKQNFTALFSQK